MRFNRRIQNAERKIARYTLFRDYLLIANKKNDATDRGTKIAFDDWDVQPIDAIANLSYYMRKTLNNLPRISGESKNNCTRRFHADSNEPENAGKACYRAERG